MMRIAPNSEKHINKMELSRGNYGYVECVVNANAEQRAEAFVRTIGKWD